MLFEDEAGLAPRAALSHRATTMLAAFRLRRAPARSFAFAVIACALLLRLMVPQGWMPVASASGWQITICTGTGPMQIAMPGPLAAALKGAHHGSTDQDHNAGDHPCTFSSLALSLDEPPLAVLALPALVAEAWLAGLPLIVGVGRGLAAPPPPATGPPATL